MLIHNHKVFIIDVLYTQDAQEITEQALTNMLIRHNIDRCDIESNAGGRAFARAVERILKNKGGSTAILPFTQSKNKTARIFSNAARVQESIYFPKLWHIDFPTFYKDVNGYLRTGTNKHDDAPDTLTGVLERGNKYNPNIKF